MSRSKTPTVTVAEVREVAEEAVDELGLQPYLNCGAISDAIREALDEKLDLPCHVEDGNVRDGPEYAEHAYVVVPGSCIDGKAGDVIVDGSVRQFDREHYDDGRAWVCLEDSVDGDLPQVAVQGRRDPLHDHYVERCPF